MIVEQAGGGTQSGNVSTTVEDGHTRTRGDFSVESSTWGSREEVGVVAVDSSEDYIDNPKGGEGRGS